MTVCRKKSFFCLPVRRPYYSVTWIKKLFDYLSWDYCWTKSMVHCKVCFPWELCEYMNPGGKLRALLLVILQRNGDNSLTGAPQIQHLWYLRHQHNGQTKSSYYTPKVLYAASAVRQIGWFVKSWPCFRKKKHVIPQLRSLIACEGRSIDDFSQAKMSQIWIHLHPQLHFHSAARQIDVLYGAE